MLMCGDMRVCTPSLLKENHDGIIIQGWVGERQASDLAWSAERKVGRVLRVYGSSRDAIGDIGVDRATLPRVEGQDCIHSNACKGWCGGVCVFLCPAR